MKKYLYKSLFALLLCLGACTSEDVWTDEQPLKNDGEISKIEAVVAAFDWEDLKSRNTISMGSFGEFVQPVWADRDTIGIYPTTGDQLSFPIVDGVGTSTCEFNGGGWALKASSKYTAYYPFNRAYYYKKNYSLPISMLGQFQKSNNSTKHLSKYDIQIAEGETPEKGMISFDFKHQVCVVRMDLEVPEEDEWTSVKLISNALFTTEATMDFSAETPVITATATSNNVTLELDDIETTEKKKILTVYMMMLPVDFTGKDLKIVLSGSRTYIADAVIVNDNRNFEAQKARWITADSFTPLVQADYSWYDSSKDTYYISNEYQLNALSKIARGNSYALSRIGESEAPTFEGKTIYLTNDIDLLSLESWTPIEQFSGTFNGNNYTIKNLYCSQSGDLGLFKDISNATIKNLKIDGSITRVFDGTESYPLYIGGIACWAVNSVFENCVSNVDITTSGDGNTSPISCSIGGICGAARNSTFIACQSSSEISDNHRPFEWAYYLGGILGYTNQNCKIIACVKTAGDVKEEYTQSYTFVGGIVGFILSGDVYTAVRSCYSSVNVEGRQPGLILGSYGTTQGTPNVSYCYYSGTGSGTYTNYIYGIGTKFYGGHEYSYDYGTARIVNLDEDIESMNAAIDEWNSANPDYKCNYKYVNGLNGLELKLQ